MSQKNEAADDQLNRQTKILEGNYEHLKDLGGNVREKYEKIYLKMVNEIQKQHFDNLLQILRHREKYAIKNVDEVIEKLRNHIASQLIRIQEKFWLNNNVNEALVTLEICKEKFKDYKGNINWDVNNKTPEERVRLIRVRLKENRLKCMKSRIEYQRKQLEEETIKNIAMRRSIEEITKQRVYTLARMERFQQDTIPLKEEIKQLQMNILDL